MKFKYIPALLIATVAAIPLPASATGIPMFDGAALVTALQKMVMDQINQMKDEALNKAKMRLEQELADATGLQYIETATATTSLVTGVITEIQNLEATTINLPPPSACNTYNSARNAQIAETTSARIADELVASYVTDRMSFGRDAKSPETMRDEREQPIFDRFASDMETNKPLLQLDANNFMRSGQYKDKQLTTVEASARKDMLELLTDVDIQQPFDFRRGPEDLTDNDSPQVIEFMRKMAKLNVARGALTEIYSSNTQDGSAASVNETISDFNKVRLLDPEWVSSVLNIKKGQKVIQPEQVARELLGINSYLAYMAEKSYRLQQWQTSIDSVALVMDLEKQPK